MRLTRQASSTSPAARRSSARTDPSSRASGPRRRASGPTVSGTPVTTMSCSAPAANASRMPHPPEKVASVRRWVSPACTPPFGKETRRSGIAIGQRSPVASASNRSASLPRARRSTASARAPSPAGERPSPSSVEGQRVPAVEVGRAQDELAEARLAEVLGEEGDVAAAELGLARRSPGQRGAARDRPQAPLEPLEAGRRVQERLERLREAPAVAEVRDRRDRDREHGEGEDGQGLRGEVGPAQPLRAPPRRARGRATPPRATPGRR